jgi:hypothetical protein
MLNHSIFLLYQAIHHKIEPVKRFENAMPFNLSPFPIDWFQSVELDLLVRLQVVDPKLDANWCLVRPLVVVHLLHHA